MNKKGMSEILQYSILIKDLITERKAFLSYVGYGSAITFLDVLKGKNNQYSVSEMIECGVLSYEKPETTKLINKEPEEICYVWYDWEIEKVY